MTNSSEVDEIQRNPYTEEVIGLAASIFGEKSRAHDLAKVGSPDLLIYLFTTVKTFTWRDVLIASGEWDRENLLPNEKGEILTRARKGYFNSVLCQKVSRCLLDNGITR